MADDNLEELTEKAKVLSEATGRSMDDVLEDLLDDGMLNKSNQGGKDLVSQLKEAAELITTVQNISKEVSTNTVLNGGDNKTEIKVDTTLEGDIVDRAIESVQRKADNLKKLLTSLIPFFLLLTGGGLEAFGVIDIVDSESEQNVDEWDEVWGCTAFDADNFNPEATADDGSCRWGGNNGGGGGGPPCNPMWRFDDYSYMVDSNIVVEFDFYDNEGCGIQLNGHFVVFLYQNGESYDDAFVNVGEFKDFVSGGTSFDDLPEGNYHFMVEFHDIECEDGSCEHGDEWTSPHQPSFYIEEEEPLVCDAYLQNEQAYLESGDAEQDAVRVSADVVVLVESEDACDSEQFELTWRLEQSGSIKYEQKTWEAGSISDSDGADYTTHLWDTVDAGTYQPKVVLKLNGEILDEKFMNSITVEEPQPDEPCDVEIINHYRGHVADDAEQDAILVAVRVVPNEYCEGESIKVDFELFQPNFPPNYTHNMVISGNSPSDLVHTFDGVSVGQSWTPTVIASLGGEVLEQVWLWGIDVVEPEPCEINLYSIGIATNSTHATVGYDLDCGYSDNELEGFNVSVQFLVYELNATNGSSPISYILNEHYIQGWVEDTRYLTLTNFTESNATHYDFYFYVIWTDGDNEVQMIERMWLNRELQA